MLRAKLIPQVLDEINSDGVKGTLLMTTDGSLLGVSGEGMEGIDDNVVGAIVSNMWSDFDKTGRVEKQRQDADQLQMMIFDMEVRLYAMTTKKAQNRSVSSLDVQDGRLAVSKVSEHYLICAYGDSTANYGSLRAKVRYGAERVPRPSPACFGTDSACSCVAAAVIRLGIGAAAEPSPDVTSF